MTASWRRWIWRHPEWWALALSAAAWIVIVTEAVVSATTPDAHHGSVAHTMSMTTRAGDWLLMIVAMMLPLCVDSIHATADRSLWRRRHRAIAAWLSGYTAVGLLFGVPLIMFSSLQLFDSASPSGTIVSAAFLLAALWQISPARARVVMACHRTGPLAPDGWRAVYDSARHGWTTGVSCSLACGALMFACWILGHSALGIIAMATATAIGVAERYIPRSNQRWLAVPIASIAVLTAATTW